MGPRVSFCWPSLCSPAQGAAVLDSLLLVVPHLDLLFSPCVAALGFGLEETNSEPLHSILPSVWVGLSKGIRFVLVVTKENVYSHIPFLQYTDLIHLVLLPTSDCPPLVSFLWASFPPVSEPKSEWVMATTHLLLAKIWVHSVERLFKFFESPNFIWESGRHQASAKVIAYLKGAPLYIAKRGFAIKHPSVLGKEISIMYL